MTQAKTGDRVKVHYTGKLTDGEVFDTSAGGDPIEFEVGGGMMIAGFDQAVSGMAVSEKKTVIIPADQAYGPHREEMVLEVERTSLPQTIAPQLGMQLQAQDSDGHPFMLTITELTENKVTLDANHPLAGQDLVFEIELVAIG